MAKIDKRVLYIGGAGLAIGAYWLYKKSKEAKTAEEEALPIVGTNSAALGQEPAVSGGGGAVGAGGEGAGLGEARQLIGQLEGKLAGSEAIGKFEAEQVSRANTEPLAQFETAIGTLKALGIPIGGGTSEPHTETPAATTSKNSQSATHSAAWEIEHLNAAGLGGRKAAEVAKAIEQPGGHPKIVQQINQAGLGGSNAQYLLKAIKGSH